MTNAPGQEPCQDIRLYHPDYVASDSWINVQATQDLIRKNISVNLDHISGFFMGFPRKALQENIYRRFLFRSYFFNPINLNTGNEDEFLARLKQIGFRILAATDVFIFHYKDVTQHRYPEKEIRLNRKGGL